MSGEMQMVHVPTPKTSPLLVPDVLLGVCQWFSPRQLRSLVQVNKSTNKTLTDENNGYWTGVAAHLLFHNEFIMELPDLDRQRFPHFNLRMPDSIPVHNLHSLMGLDISRGKAYELFAQRMDQAIRVYAPTLPHWAEYVGLSTRAMVNRQFLDKVDPDLVEEMMDAGQINGSDMVLGSEEHIEWVRDAWGSEADRLRFWAARDIARVMVRQTLGRTPRQRTMQTFVNKLEDDAEISNKIKRKMMRSLRDLAPAISNSPGRVFSFREVSEAICKF